MTDLSRRGFLGAGGLALAGASMVSGRTQAASLPEAPTMTEATMQPPLYPKSGPDYQPVVTLNGWTLPWRRTATGRSSISSPSPSCASSRPA